MVKEGEPRSKLAEQVARRIQEEVKARGWPVGDVLGSEPELIARYGVSRSTFREAVRLVENRNVAYMRKGPGGGLVVVAPDGSAIADAVSLYLEYRNLDPSALFETRRALELTSVELATSRLTEAGAQQLRAIVDKEGETLSSVADLTRQDVHPFDLHVAIAELSGDPALHLFVEVVCRLAPQRLHPPSSYRGAAEQLHEAHKKITESIVGGDAALARRRMLHHLEAVERFASADGTARPAEPAAI